MGGKTVKPKVFVGSSTEAKPIAQVLCDSLRDEATMVPWWHSPEFKPGFSTLDGLSDAVDIYDFGLFLLTPDDSVESRGAKGRSARDNVLFEYGLFLGSLGRYRTFAFIQEVNEKGKAVKLASDLSGIHIPRFADDSAHELIASVNSALNDVRGLIKSIGKRQKTVSLVSSWGYDQHNATFSMTLSVLKLQRYRERLRDRRLVLVVRKQDENIDVEDDNRIAVGKPRMVSTILAGDLVLRASNATVFSRVKPGDIVEGYLFLLPGALSLERCRTIRAIRKRGGELLDIKGRRVSLNR